MKNHIKLTFLNYYSAYYVQQKPMDIHHNSNSKGLTLNSQRSNFEKQ